MLPFSERDFLDVFAAYHAALWPGALVLWIVTAGFAMRLWLAEPPHRAMSLLLAALWAWTAIGYHAMFFTRINPAAWLFAAAFLCQAALFVRAGLRREPLQFSRGRSPRHVAAGALIACGLAYPMLVSLEGFSFPRMPTFGVPCPTSLVTAGVLLAAHRPSPLLVIIPIAWALVGGSAAWLLGVRTDLTLFAAAASLILQQAAQWHHRAPHAAPV